MACARAASEEPAASARAVRKEAVACARQAGGGEETVARGGRKEVRRTMAGNRAKGEDHGWVREG